MERNDKIVFEDEDKVKIIRGQIVKEDEFVYDILTSTGQTISIGKRAVVQVRRGDEK